MKFFFILIFLLSLHAYSDNKNAYAQTKIDENFEGPEFPPEGWSVINQTQSKGEWKITDRLPRSGTQCVVSNFTTTGSENILVTKRFTVSEGDSLVFYFRQSFWNNYQDTFEVFISIEDSLSIMSGTRLISLKDSISYPVPFSYERKSLSLNDFAGETCWIGFRHVNLDGDNIRLDEITVGQAAFSEVGVTGNLFPAGNVSTCAFDFLIPKATIENFGNSDISTPFSITYKITGVTEYTSTVYDTLSMGNSKTIYFDTLYADLPGTCEITIFTSLEGDQNPGNDTLYSEFNIVNANFGGGLIVNGNYYFSNSNTCSFQSPSFPEFCWKDTTGSTSLIINGEDVSGGLLTGDTDNGYFRLGNILPDNVKITYYKTHFDSVFISTNGLIGFKNNPALKLSDPEHIMELMSKPVPILSALWMDMDYGNSISAENRLCYKVAGNQLIITFNKVPLRSGGEDDYISYQIVIETGNPVSQNSKLILQYNKEQTGRSFIEKYNNEKLPLNLIGMKNTFSNNYLIYRGKDPNGLIQAGPFLNSSLALTIGTSDTALDNKCSALNMRVLLEAGYNSGDTIEVSIRDHMAPYKILESKKIYLSSSGIINTGFTIPMMNYRYYLTVDHRNSLYTWSRENGELFSDYVLDYDFTAGQSMAYGGNLALFEDKTYIYTGDINKDDVIDSDDLIGISNGISEFYLGYNTEDLTLDGVVDLEDLVYAYNNVKNFIIIMAP
ncbi:MAG TPA: choice-of-anchor J domain-containing protein [Ignavibacteria bacterium]|nr:choice-of-anchor J domain-containing protein [Ignavibacteria bacterium]